MITNQLNKLSLALFMGFSSVAYAQQINDNNTPLHLMKPEYRVGYGVSKVESVKQTMDRVLNYIDAETPAVLVDKKTGKEVARMKDINADTYLKQGGFRLTSYEWGVTYSGVLAAYEATGDEAYKNYVYKRHKLLAEMAPYFTKIHQKGSDIDVNVRRVIDPHALDDAGAVCCSMIKSMATIFKAIAELRAIIAEAQFDEEPGARNSKRLPVKAKGDVRLRSVLSIIRSGICGISISMPCLPLRLKRSSRSESSI